MEKFKKKKDEEEKVRLEEVYEDFRDTFEEGKIKISKTFIRGDVVNPDKSIPTTGSQSAIYKPMPKIQIKPAHSLEMAKRIAEETAKKIMKEASTEKPVKTEKPSRFEPITPAVEKPPKPGTKKVAEKSRLTNLEAFKEELKQMQAMRDERKGLRKELKEKLGVPDEELNRIAPALDSPYMGPGVPANVDFENDPSTTNLYVCNLPPDAKNEDFFETFGTFGPLASAKILFPKDGEERFRNTLSGFVAFMHRMDAERALCAMHGDVMRGCELRVSWARPVPIPPLPFYVPPPLRELAMPDPPSGLPFNAKPESGELRAFLHKYHDLPKLGAPLASTDPAMCADYKKMIENATVRVVIPTERPLLQLIHRVVEFMVRSGPMFEAVLMARERQNPMYRFLFDNHHPTHVFYRWRLFSVLQGDDRQRWRLDKFKLFEGGSWWQPPPHALFELGMPPQLYDTAYVPRRRRDRAYEKRTAVPTKRRHASGSDGSGDEEEKERRRRRALKEDLEREEKQKRMRGVLSDEDRQELEELLRNLTPEKIAIGDAMIWCLDHAECSKEVAQCIYESLCIKETPLHKKIARIFLVSDILANCTARVKDVFYYRQHLGDYLQKIFVELNETLEAIGSRLKAEQFRQRVMLCFRNWEDNALYPTHDLIQWQNIFLGLLKTEDPSIDGEPMPPEEEAELIDEDLDGMPMPDEELDGVPMPEEGDEDDIDGVPMEADEPTASPAQDSRFTTGSWSMVEPEQLPPAESAPTSTKSKWESIEISRWGDPQANVSSAFAAANEAEEDDGEESGQMRKQKLTRLSPSPPLGRQSKEMAQSAGGSANVAGGELEGIDEEERRKILREIEVKVMKLQDELESEEANNMPPEEINAELAKYRQKLMARAEEKLGKAREKDVRKESRRRHSPEPSRAERRNSSNSMHESGREEKSSRRSRDENGRGRREQQRTPPRRERSPRDRSRNGRDRPNDRSRSRERRERRSDRRDRSRSRSQERRR